MAIKIQRLICNVTVVASAGATGSINRSPPDTTSAQPVNATTDAAVHAESADGDVGAHGASMAIDPRAVADRVYRLMRDELTTDRERE